MKLTLSAKKNDRSWIIYVAAAAGLVSVVMALITILGGPSHIEDVNGEDTSLAVITMEDILSDRHQSVSFMSSTRTPAMEAVFVDSMMIVMFRILFSPAKSLAVSGRSIQPG